MNTIMKHSVSGYSTLQTMRDVEELIKKLEDNAYKFKWIVYDSYRVYCNFALKEESKRLD